LHLKTLGAWALLTLCVCIYACKSRKKDDEERERERERKRKKKKEEGGNIEAKKRRRMGRASSLPSVVGRKLHGTHTEYNT
jgi:hypothetical protein